jgi:hypothetical protein
MGKFTPESGLPVFVRHDNEGTPFETAAPIRYENQITSLTIPAGFELDFASIPRPLWWLWPKVGRYARAALVHDVLYRQGNVKRVQADALFLSIMEDDGVKLRDRWPLYTAVRLFGWIAWLKLRWAEEEEPGYDWRKPRQTEGSWAPIVVTLMAMALVLLLASLSAGASYRTRNFVATAQSPDFAREVGEAAEAYRSQLAEYWIGAAMPDWSQPCPITANLGSGGAGGMTSFEFLGGEVVGWQMEMGGGREQILGSTLPHEITHTVFASYFRKPIPRWADEGGCSTIEQADERAKLNRILMGWFGRQRIIGFPAMFAMADYPPGEQLMLLYAQGHSLASMLIDQSGPRHYVAFLGDGLGDSDWERAVTNHYGDESLIALQRRWYDWARSPESHGVRRVAYQCPPGVNCPFPAQGQPQMQWGGGSTFAGGATWSSPPLTSQPAATGADPATALVSVQDRGNTVSHASGVLVEHAGGVYVLTNAHEVRDAASDAVTVRFPQVGPEAYQGRVVAKSEAGDCCVIRLAKQTAIKPLRLAKVLGKGVFRAFGWGGPGNPLGTYQGPYAQVLGDRNQFFEFQSGSIPRLGDSGGPVFNEQGEIAGIIMGNDPNLRRTVAVRTEVLAEAIEGLGVAVSSRPLTPVARTPVVQSQVGPSCREACQAEIDKIRSEVGGIRDDLAKWRKDQQAWRVLVESRIDAVPKIDPEKFVKRDQYRAERDSQLGIVDGLKAKLEGVAKAAAVGAKEVASRKLDEVAIGALGLGGPIGIGLAVGLWFARRKVRSLIDGRKDQRGDGQGAAPDRGFHSYD